MTPSGEAGAAADAGGRPQDGRSPARWDRLLRDLTAVGDDVPLVLVVAPAGYGKTTLLRQWADEDDRRFGWVQLRESDNDPRLLLRHIAGALHQVRAPGGTNRPETSEADAPWVLVLDDAHLLRHHRSLDVVTTLLGDVPARCKVVVAGRSRPGLDLGRSPGGGRYAEFGPEELSLTIDEVEILVAGVGLDIPRDAVAALRARTEGWPAGTYLAALSIAGATDIGAAAATIGGDDAFIADYLRDEVLGRESAEVVGFLLHTAPLEQLTASLCDAVVGRSGSAVRLAEIERRNLFVALIPAGQGGNRRWYRYHRLFAEMLRSELARREPGEERRVHRRAAAWYDAHTWPEQAVQHALAGRDTANVARLISRYASRLINEGRIEVLQRWLADLDAGALEEYPRLATWAGWVWAIAGDVAFALRCLLAAEAGARSAGEPASGTRLTAGTAVLRTALAPEGVEGMLRDARHAIAVQPAAGPDRVRAIALLGVAHLLNGSTDVGAMELDRAAVLGRRHGSHREARFALAQLSLLAADAADWAAAADYADESWAMTEQTRLAEYAANVPTHVARATVAVHAAIDEPHGTASAGRCGCTRGRRWPPFPGWAPRWRSASAASCST
jgi:LuxR family maltose regulon positive regulatory protein